MLRAAEKEMRAVRAPDHAAELHERIAQLELELSAKAEEIEEADTRIPVSYTHLRAHET